MKKYILLLLIFIIFGCYSPSISVNQSKNNQQSKKKTENENKNIELKKEISSDEYVYLFFNRANFIKQPSVQTAVIPVEINSNDYKVVVDWLYEGGRKIRLRNIKTGKEYIISDNDTKGEVILVERALLYYKFKIGNSIIKVKK